MYCTVEYRAEAAPILGYPNGIPTAVWHVCSYKKLPVDMKPGSQILCADGSIVMEVISTDPKAGTVRVKCLNNATLGCAQSLLTSSLPFPLS